MNDYWYYKEYDIYVNNRINQIPDGDQCNFVFRTGGGTVVISKFSTLTKKEYRKKYCVEGEDGKFYYKMGLPANFDYKMKFRVKSDSISGETSSIDNTLLNISDLSDDDRLHLAECVTEITKLNKKDEPEMCMCAPSVCIIF